MIIRLEQMRQLVEIYRFQSVTQAAQILQTSQPSLSRSIGKLEADLGVTFFERTSHGVEFTDEGRLIAEQAAHILQEAETLESIGRNKTQIKGTVHISIGSAFYHYLAADLLIAFHRSYPQVDLTVTENSVHTALALLENDKTNLGVVYANKTKNQRFEEDLQERELAFISLGEVTHDLFVGLSDRLLGQKEISMAEVSELQLIDCESGWNNIFRAAGYPLLNKMITVSERSVQKQLVRQGIGAALLPKWKSSGYLPQTEKTLHRITIFDAKDANQVKLYLVYAQNKPLSVLEREAIRLVKAAYAKQTY